MEALRLADEIRAYSALMRSSLADNGTDATDDVVAWLSWAEDHADRIDPRLICR